MASGDNPFGLGPDDFDRFAREARDMVGRFLSAPGAQTAWTALFDDGTRRHKQPEPATTGETGTGVWAVFVVDDVGGARVEQVYADELDALRANQRNTDPTRRVRFLPYGITVSALDEQHRIGDDPDSHTGE